MTADINRVLSGNPWALFAVLVVLVVVVTVLGIAASRYTARQKHVVLSSRLVWVTGMWAWIDAIAPRWYESFEPEGEPRCTTSSTSA